jgi:hypothetical protein
MKNLLEAVQAIRVQLEAQKYRAGQILVVDVYNSGAETRVSLREIPQDPYGQVYDTYLLLGPKTAIDAAQKLLADEKFRTSLEDMRLHAAQKALHEAILKALGKPMNIKWHYYSMPD